MTTRSSSGASRDAAPHRGFDSHNGDGRGDDSTSSGARRKAAALQSPIDRQKENGGGGALSAILGLARRRRFLIGLANKTRNTAAAYLRSAMGWSMALPEAERDAIKRHAAAVLEQFLAGEAPPDYAVLLVSDELAIVRVTLELIDQRRAVVEADMEALARGLPGHAFVKSVAGFGDRGFAVIVAEAGDLSGYPNVRHLWKRLGLAPYEGRAMSRWGAKELSSEEWTEAGYAPRRRAELHAFIGDAMFRHQIEGAKKSGLEFGRAKGPYGAAYIARREATKAAHPEWSAKHADMDARRIMTKLLIADLWSAWGRPRTCLNAMNGVAAPELLPIAGPEGSA